jgi:hypothetical protein
VHILVSRQLVDLSIDCFVHDRVSLSIPTFGTAIRANCNRDIHSARNVSLTSPLSERQFLHCFHDHSAPAKITNPSFAPASHGPKPIWTARSLPDLGLPACKAAHIFRKKCLARSAYAGRFSAPDLRARRRRTLADLNLGVVNKRQNLAEVARVDMRSADRTIPEIIGLSFGDAVRIEPTIPACFRIDPSPACAGLAQ